MMKIPKMNAKRKGVVKKLTAAQKEFNFEVSFAKKLVEGEVKITDYPYYKSYRKTLNIEKTYLPSPVAVLGSGPLPLSLILLKSSYAINVGLDSSKKAVNLSKSVLSSIGALRDVLLVKAELYADYDEFRSILVTLGAGDTQKKKEKILNNVYTQIGPNTNVVVRSSNADNFIKVSLDTKKWKIIKELSIFDGLSTSYVLKPKFENTTKNTILSNLRNKIQPLCTLVEILGEQEDGFMDQCLLDARVALPVVKKLLSELKEHN